MNVSVSADGMWYENSWGYHFYTLQAMILIAEYARRLDIDLWSHPSLQKMFPLAVHYTMADGSLPRFGDDVQSWARSVAPYVEFAYAAAKDPTLVALLSGRVSWDSILLGRDVGQVQEVPPLTSRVFRSAGHAILRTRGQAGLTAAFTFLNDLQMNMIFRAVEKNEHAQMVNAQTVTVLNNNRANVSVINQTSYVRDFDVEVAQASFIADPKIDVIHDGVVLDVRPIIRHDRRSVTLVLQPTVAELQRPIPQFTTSLAGSTLPVTLQLPVLTVRSFATTAQVPDGGTVLIGGLRTILSRERRAEIPILAKIPIISFFFKQEGVIDESSSLMVMVKAQITDVVDKMNAFEGK